MTQTERDSILRARAKYHAAAEEAEAAGDTTEALRNYRAALECDAALEEDGVCFNKVASY